MTYTATIKKLLHGVLGQRLYHRISALLFSVYRPFFMFSLSDLNDAALLRAPGYKIIRIKKKDVPLLERFTKNELTKFDLINIPSFFRIEKPFANRAYWGIFSGDRLICVLWINLFGLHDIEYGCAIAETFRRRGIGAAALHSVERYFLKKGKQLFVRVREGNDAGMAFFMRNDFNIYDKKGEWSFLRKSQQCTGA